jgi:hypothetical protein
VFASRAWARVALFFNLLGTVILFFSFQATSSKIRIITTSDQSETALCVDREALFVITKTNWRIGGQPCPELEHARPAAVVNVERPSLVTVGFVILAAGFLIQLLSVPDPTTIDQLRRELKELKRKHSYRRH